MYTALVKSSNIKVNADEANRHLNEFLCEKCKSSVILKKGLVRSAHFSHTSGSACDYAGESELHVRIKKNIYYKLKSFLKGKIKSIDIEKHLGDVRPDIYIEGNKNNVAIEIQASGLTPQEIIYRTKKYHDKNIYLLWVLPFKEERFYNINNRGQKVLQPVKLREYERIIMYMYYKTVVYWDIDNYNSDDFIVVGFEDAYSDSSEFYDVEIGDTVYYEPKRLKTLKEPARIKFDVTLDKFKPSYAKEFPMPMADYDLPARKILTFDWRKA